MRHTHSHCNSYAGYEHDHAHEHSVTDLNKHKNSYSIFDLHAHEYPDGDAKPDEYDQSYRIVNTTTAGHPSSPAHP